MKGQDIWCFFDLSRVPWVGSSSTGMNATQTHWCETTILPFSHEIFDEYKGSRFRGPSCHGAGIKRCLMCLMKKHNLYFLFIIIQLWMGSCEELTCRWYSNSLSRSVLFKMTGQVLDWFAEPPGSWLVLKTFSVSLSLIPIPDCSLFAIFNCIQNKI